MWAPHVHREESTRRIHWGNGEKLLWLHTGHGVKKEAQEVVEGRTCKAL